MKHRMLPLLIGLALITPAHADEAARQKNLEILTNELEQLKQQMQEMYSRWPISSRQARRLRMKA